MERDWEEAGEASGEACTPTHRGRRCRGSRGDRRRAYTRALEENKRATASRSKTASTPPAPRKPTCAKTSEPGTASITDPDVPDNVTPSAPEPVPESEPPVAPTSTQDEAADDTETDTSPDAEDTTEPPVWTDPVDPEVLAHALTVFADADADPKNPNIQHAASAAAREVGAPISAAALQLADDRLAEQGLLTVEDQDARAMEVGVTSLRRMAGEVGVPATEQQMLTVADYMEAAAGDPKIRDLLDQYGALAGTGDMERRRRAGVELAAALTGQGYEDLDPATLQFDPDSRLSHTAQLDDILAGVGVDPQAIKRVTDARGMVTAQVRQLVSEVHQEAMLDTLYGTDRARSGAGAAFPGIHDPESKDPAESRERLQAQLDEAMAVYPAGVIEQAVGHWGAAPVVRWSAVGGAGHFRAAGTTIQEPGVSARRLFARNRRTGGLSEVGRSRSDGGAPDGVDGVNLFEVTEDNRQTLRDMAAQWNQDVVGYRAEPGGDTDESLVDVELVELDTPDGPRLALTGGDPMPYHQLHPELVVSGPHTVVHELGHMVEGAHPAVRAAAHGFLAARSQGKGTTTITAVDDDGQKVTMELVTDGFCNPYTSRTYPSGDTEVISTGMEYLFGPPPGETQRERSMSSFADKGRDGLIRGGSAATGDPDAFSDPGHRNLILGVLRLIAEGYGDDCEDRVSLLCCDTGTLFVYGTQPRTA